MPETESHMAVAIIVYEYVFSVYPYDSKNGGSGPLQ